VYPKVADQEAEEKIGGLLRRLQIQTLCREDC
jgi:hypothetical protein